MLSSIFHSTVFSATNVMAAMAVSLILGLIIGKFYMAAGAYRKNFVVILSTLPMLVCMIIMIVNGSVGASVAVLGAFGLVRFRSAPGSARDIGFIFFSMAIGLATGMGYLTMAILLTGVIGISMLVLCKSSYANETCVERALRITVPEDLNYVGAFDDLFTCYAEKNTLVSVKTTNMGTMYELRYDIRLRDAAQEKEFIDALRCRNGNLTIVLGLAQREKDEL